MLFSCCLISFFTFGTLESNAADGTENISAYDLEIYAETWDYDGSILDVTDVSDEVSTSSYLSSLGLLGFAFPYGTTGGTRCLAWLTLSEDFDFNSSHEYRLKFDWSYYIQLDCSLRVSLVFYDSTGSEIKRQVLVDYTELGSVASQVHSVDLDFKADMTGITSAYTCQLCFDFSQGGFNSSNGRQIFFISKQIILEDKDDDSGWFEKILNAIKSIPDNISTFFNNLALKITELGDKIGNFFVELKDGLVDGLKSLFIPEDGYFESFMEKADIWLTEHFGVLYQVTDLFITFINQLINLSPETPAITIPAIEFSLFDEHFILVEEIEYTFDWLYENSHPLYYFYQFYRGFTVFVMFFMFLNYVKDKYNDVFDAGG